jgi:hypothetical protein
MRNLLDLAIAALLTVSFVAWQSGDVRAGEGYGKQKVVYHINFDDPKAQAGALGNIQNHITATDWHFCWSPNTSRKRGKSNTAMPT